MTEATAKKRAGRKPPPGGARQRMFQMRMNDAEYEQLQAKASAEGVKVADLVRDKLGLDGTAVSASAPARAESVESPTEAAATPEARTADLAQWISGRTGLPRAIAARYVKSGRVQVAGAECREERVDVALLDRVDLDGDRL